MATELIDINSFPMFHGNTDGGVVPATSEVCSVTITTDLAFRSVLRKGSWEKMHQYIEANHETIVTIIEKRLGVVMNSENIMIPEGRVYDEHTSDGSRLEDSFTQGRNALHTGDFIQAEKYFAHSTEIMTGANRTTAENYRAYALILLGETLRARMILSPMVAGRCSFPSAYWNLACSMTDEQQKERLAVLSSGLGKAAHMRLLMGAVAIGIRIGHAFLSEWLLSLPMLEAQLLVCHLSCDTMSPKEKEMMLLRIGNYVYDGEPEVPDPLEHILPPPLAKEFFRNMSQRQQHSEPVEFWFRCRRRIAFMRYDFWKIKADYYEQFGLRHKAVGIFKTELYCRLQALASNPRFKTNSMFLDATRLRIGIYICRCMTPALRKHGRIIARMISRFESEHGISLLPENLNLQPLYDDEPSAVLPPKQQYSGRAVGLLTSRENGHVHRCKK